MLRVAEASHRTDTGRQREANEDSMFARAPVFAVADGMGGAQAGEVASQIAVEAFEPERDDELAPEEYLTATAQRANREIFELAQGDRSRSGMGTTLTAAVVQGSELSLGHVGDSRAYRFRDGELTQLTSDHSLVEELRRQGKITADQAAEHPQRSVITRALGPERDVAVDTMTVAARDGDVYLLCSDGLTSMISDEEIASVFAKSDNLDNVSRRLIRLANDHGGRDNITVIVFRLEEIGDGAAPETEETTLVGTAAEEQGFTADAVREGVERERVEPEQARARPERPIAVPSGKAELRGPWRGRILRVLATAAIVGLVGFGAWYGSRQIYFLGADEGGRVALFRGLPYELPFGLELYSEVFSSPVTVSALPEDRRAAAIDHELRSRDDAVSLLEDLQRAAYADASATPAPDSSAGGSGSNEARSGGQASSSGGGGGGSG